MIETDSAAAYSRVNKPRGLPERPSLTWLLPLAAIVFAAWVLWDSYTERGPLVEITFDKAGGVVAGETRVRRNDVDVGRVESVRLAEDLNSVVVNVRMVPQVAPYLDSDTRFWIVNARINTTEISGLGTLLSGSFIEVDWDDVPGTRQSEYIGLQEPPLTTRGTPGLRLTLSAEEAGYIYVGSPVFLRQIEVGRVERRRLSPDATEVLFDIFIEAPYHRNVYPATRFYGVSGVEGRVDADGASVRVESIAALFTGGIAFENPRLLTRSEPVENDGRRYRLFDSRAAARASLFDGEQDERFRFVAEFPGTVAGLRADTPIDYNGMRVGLVRSVTVKSPTVLGGKGSAMAVLQFQPTRLGLAGVSQTQWHEAIGALVESGLRVQLTSGNLLTRSLGVRLVMKPELPTQSIDHSHEPYPALPVVPANIETVTADVETLVKNLSALPLNDLVLSATALLQDARRLIAGPAMASLPTDLSATLSSIASSSAQVETATAELPELIAQLRQLSVNANDVLQGVSPDSQIYFELSSAVRELRIAARSIAAFAELLEENPNALLTGR